MKRLRVLWGILKRTRADQILIGFVFFIFAVAGIILLVEPEINRYSDALWYCYAVLSTVGFGDLIAVTFVGKIASVLLSVYALFVTAIVTGVVVNFYQQMVAMQHQETMTMFLDKLERLPDLSREELIEISVKIKKSR